MTTWRAHAACLDQAPHFDDYTTDEDNPRERLDRAIRVCAGCPVRNECVADAVENQGDGIRGGRLFDMGKPVDLPRPGSKGEPRKSPPAPSPCGTYSAYRRHRRNNDEEACTACKAAAADYSRFLRERQRKKREAGVTLQPCGTWAAYSRHIDRGEPTDEACKRAAREKRAKYPRREAS